MKGKKLYAACRAFATARASDLREDRQLTDEEPGELMAKGVELGIDLLVDVAESLRRIAGGE